MDQTVGSGSDNLVLRISQDAYRGSAQYTIRVDGGADRRHSYRGLTP